MLHEPNIVTLFFIVGYSLILVLTTFLNGVVSEKLLFFDSCFTTQKCVVYVYLTHFGTRDIPLSRTVVSIIFSDV